MLPPTTAKVSFVPNSGLQSNTYLLPVLVRACLNVFRDRMARIVG